jgi:GntR family transcriptional regulator/MocR family aminotransferase
MARRTTLQLAVLQPGDPTSLTRQLSDALRRAILVGQLRPNTRLPSTRALAGELGVSRNTVLDAYAQLASEGYFSARTGSGTFVTTSLPEHSLDRLDAAARRPPARGIAPPALSTRGAAMAAAPLSVSDGRIRAFSPGIPALEQGNLDMWNRTRSWHQRHTTVELLNYNDPAGHRALREAIAAYVGPMRGVVCTAEQVIVTAGTQQALDLAVRMLVDPGESAWLEDPGYPGARAVLAAAGVTIVPAPVDEDGMCVQEAQRRAPRARLAYVSPSHQYPLGYTMSVTRRLQLLEWAEASHAWILEDDYDSEFRYGGRPLPALQALDRTGRVLYLGTFSKVLFPSLRIGYVIVPATLTPVFRNASSVAWHGANAIDQAALADFIRDGHFERHIRRMRRRYQERRAWLVDLIHDRLRDDLTLAGSTAGLHVTACFVRRRDDVEVSRRGAAEGLTLPPLSQYYIQNPRLAGLVLGYGHLGHDAIRAGVDTLAAILRDVTLRRSTRR